MGKLRLIQNVGLAARRELPVKIDLVRNPHVTPQSREIAPPEHFSALFTKREEHLARKPPTLDPIPIARSMMRSRRIQKIVASHPDHPRLTGDDTSHQSALTGTAVPGDPDYDPSADFSVDTLDQRFGLINSGHRLLSWHSSCAVQRDDGGNLVIQGPFDYATRSGLIASIWPATRSSATSRS